VLDADIACSSDLAIVMNATIQKQLQLQSALCSLHPQPDVIVLQMEGIVFHAQAALPRPLMALSTSRLPSDACKLHMFANAICRCQPGLQTIIPSVLQSLVMTAVGSSGNIWTCPRSDCW
jgi:hypothetical protein